MGARGVAEIRSEGLHVTLGDESSQIETASAKVIIKDNPLIDAVARSRSLSEAEAALRLIGCPSEIDFERRKASKIQDQERHPKPEPFSLVKSARSIGKSKRTLGVDFLTLRRLFEMMRSELSTYSDLHEQFRNARANEYRPPLWVLNQHAWPDSHPS